MFEETPKIDFSIKDENGIVLFRDALIFSSMSELRNTSSAERQQMMQQRYNDWKASLENVEQEVE